ncbi:MAG: flavodoxin family protein [Desulfobulbaceae bacterium]|jgi:multimeric flavodoxin WrbA|nr:flavodoxin family protein [Desulfobulbaceae bacterium]
MNILALYASPRPQGNSAQLLNALLAEAEHLGATSKRYTLNTLRLKGCQACYSCRQPGKEKQCAVKDDMQPILADLFAADAVVLASPVYMWQMTAQAKLFTDRLMPVLKPDYTSWLNGQRLLVLYTQGQPDLTRFASYFEYANSMFSFLGFRTLEPLVFGNLRDRNDIRQQPQHFERVRQAAAELVGKG